jgi:drug/metabolite transporter (DMT)-like permease
MVAWWKRLMFSLASVVAAVVVCLAVLMAADVVLKGKIANIHSSEVGIAVGVTIALCLVGWVITAPLVLIVRNVPGGRFWIYWVIGSCVGPVLMLGLFAAVFFLVPHSPTDHWIRPELWPLVYLAAAISSLTSVFYLFLLRWGQARASAHSAKVAASGGLL